MDPGVAIKERFRAGKEIYGWLLQLRSSGMHSEAQEKSGWFERRNSMHAERSETEGIGLACCNHVSGTVHVSEFDGLLRG